MIDGEIPTAAMQRLTRIDLKTAYACIYFNTGDEADALDLLQRPLAGSLLDERNSDRLAECLAQHQGFSHVLQRVLADRVQTDARPLDQLIAELTTVASVLTNDLLVQATTHNSALAPVIPYLASGLLQYASTITGRPDGAAWLAQGWGSLVVTLLNQPGGDLLLASVIDSLKATPHSELVTLLSDAEREALYRDNLSVFLGSAKAREGIASSTHGLALGLAGLGFARLIDTAGDLDDATVAKLMPLGGVESASRYLAHEIAGGSFDGIDVEMMRWLKYVNADPANTATKALANYTTEDDVALAAYVLKMVPVILKFAEEAPDGSIGIAPAEASVLLGEKFQALVAAGEFPAAAHLGLIFLAGSTVVPAEALQGYLKGLSFASFVGRPKDLPRLVSAMLLASKELGLEPLLFRQAFNLPDFRAMFLAFTTSSDFVNGALANASVPRVVEAIDAIVSTHATESDPLVDGAILGRLGSSTAEQLSQVMLTSEMRWRWFSRAIALVSNPSVKVGLLASAKSALSSRSRSEWSGDSDSYSWVDRLALEIRDLDDEFHLALIGGRVARLVDLSASGKLTASWPPPMAAKFCRLLKKSIAKQMAKEEVRRVVEGASGLHAEYWKTSGSLILNHLESSHGFADFPSFASAMVYGANSVGLSWLLANFRNLSAAQRLASDQVLRSALHDDLRLAIAATDDDEDRLPILKKLKSALAVMSRAKKRRKLRSR